MSISKETLLKLRYTNFHRHTMFSLLDGVGSVKDHIIEDFQKGHQASCITDHGVMSGCLQLYRLCNDQSFLSKNNIPKPIQPILGNELYITDDLARRDPTNKYNHITVLAKNATGYKNLTKLTSFGSLPDHKAYGRPRISFDELFAHKEGLIVSSGCFLGCIPRAIHKNTGNEEELVRLFKDNFGDDFFFEFHLCDLRWDWNKVEKNHNIDNGYNLQEKVNRRLMELSDKFGIKICITQDSHMPKAIHHMIQNIMIWNSQSGKDKNKENGWHFREAYPVMDVLEMYSRTQQIASYITDEQFIEYCNNTEYFRKKCEGFALSFSPQLPEFNYKEHPINKIPELEAKLNEMEDKFRTDVGFSHLLQISRTDIALRTALKVIIFNNKFDLANSEYRSRLVLELNTIQRSGIIKLIDYFMPLEDVTRFVKERKRFRGFGRGSAGGCLVAYGLDITDVNPIEYGLFFERFLTKERIGTMDFSVPEVQKKAA